MLNYASMFAATCVNSCVKELGKAAGTEGPDMEHPHRFLERVVLEVLPLFRPERFHPDMGLAHHLLDGPIQLGAVPRRLRRFHPFPLSMAAAALGFGRFFRWFEPLD